MNTPPNEQRGFVHKRLFGAAKGFVTSGFNPLGALGGFVSGGQNGGGSVRAPRGPSASELAGIRDHVAHGHGLGAHTFLTAANLQAAGVPTGRPAQLPRGGSNLAGTGCTFPARRDPNTGECRVFIGREPGPDVGGVGADAVMGRYGAGMIPMKIASTRSDCSAGGTVRGMVLGNDGVCYNKRDIRNSERMWPKGRAPLLTGGEQKAISVASRAAGKLMRSRKRLKKVASTFAKAC